MLLDTAGLLTLWERTQPLHAQAAQIYASKRRRVTHNYILAEMVALAHARSLPIKGVLESLGDLMSDPTVELVWVDQALHEAAIKLLAARLNRHYSLCDAVSFILMRQRGLREALTTDHHFEQEGFVRLLV